MKPLDLKRVKVLPLGQRKSMSQIGEILVNPDLPPPPCSPALRNQILQCAKKIRAARARKAAVMLLYGAHLVKNGGASVAISLMYDGWVTHLATNGAGTIHDWEFAYCGWSTESVEKNVATGTFGTWFETGRNIQLALLAGALEGLGYGASLGKFIEEDGVTLPGTDELESALRAVPRHPLSPARAELLQAMIEHPLPPGRIIVKHPWKRNSILGQAWQQQIPMTVHPGIGYDIISNHPMFNGAVIGRGGGTDFRLFGGSVAALEGGVVMSVGSAIMAPQVFEKSLSCVNNLRLQAGQGIIRGHDIFVVDLQDGGQWDWSQGEPPKDHPAYYLRFCKSFSRMGGAMHYVQSDNVLFLHHLLHELRHTEETGEQ
ncbi:MAG: hypothetical protein WCO56_26700 [Verrucomicrobiota bacterium]